MVRPAISRKIVVKLHDEEANATHDSKISKFDSFELISDACLCHCIIRALRKEFMPFISLVQGWVSQPSIIEL